MSLSLLEVPPLDSLVSTDESTDAIALTERERATVYCRTVSSV